MIRKCQTISNNKERSTVAKCIQISQFIDNEEEATKCFESPSKQIQINIEKIKLCRLETAQLVQNLTVKVQSQQLIIKELQEQLMKQKQRSRQFKFKYHESLIQLRKKQQEKQAISRHLNDNIEKKNILAETSHELAKEYNLRQIKYQERINDLVPNIELISSANKNNCLNSTHYYGANNSAKDSQLRNESTFI